MRSNMMRALGLPSGVRTQMGPLGWICIIWFISTTDVTAGNGIELQTIPWVVATCGDNVTLTCDVTGTEVENIQKFYWMEKEETFCEFGEIQSANNTQFLCHNTSEANRLSFNLTIMKITPANKGTYHCKLRTNKGADNGKTIVRIEDCIEESSFSVSESDTECTFTGVYPPGQVKWTLGGIELTDVTTTQEEEADGRLTVKSKVNKRKENTNELYTCSLLLPTNSSEQMHVVRKLVFSGGAVVKLTWICMLVEMLLLILVIQF